MAALLSAHSLITQNSLQDAASFVSQLAKMQVCPANALCALGVKPAGDNSLARLQTMLQDLCCRESQNLNPPAHPQHPQTAGPVVDLAAAGDKMSRISPDRGRIMTNMTSVALGLPTSWLVLKGLPTANVGQHTLLYAVVLGTFGSLISW